MDIKNVEEANPSTLEYALKRSMISRNKLAIIIKTDTGTEYCCVECEAKYTEKEELEVHLCTHNKQYRYLCGICGTGLKRKEHLERHTLEHQEVRPYKCPICNKAFKRKEHLNIHKSIHNGEKDQVCTLCNRSFNRKDHLQKHLQTHSKLFLEQHMYPLDEQGLLEIKGEPEFIEVKDDDEYMDMVKEEMTEDDVNAYDCDVSFMEYDMEGSEPIDNDEYADSYQEPNVEIRTPDSANSERPFVCTVCYKSYKRKDHLKIHSWTHLEKDKICNGCGKAFHTEVQLLSHMHTCVQVHLKLKGIQTEPSDDFNIDDLSSNNPLLVETRRRPPSEARPHECGVCQRRFKRKQHLKVHANVHRRQEPTIWCSLCNEGFLSNSQFESHQCSAAGEGVARAPDRKENKYPEEMLGQESSPSVAIRPEAADEQNIPVPQRVFVCRFCQKPFRRRDHYKIHLHIHTGVKDFFCPDCGKGFYRKDHLQKHTQTHFKQAVKPKLKKQLPGLVPISLMAKKTSAQVKPEITITAPSNSKLRVPLQIKVPYQVVVARRGLPARRGPEHITN